MRLVLSDCQKQLKMLLEKLRPFMQYLGSSPSERMGIRARISTILSRQDIDSYRQGIQRQGQLVNLLLTILQHQSILKIREILEGLEFQDLLQKSHQDTKSLRTASEKAKSSFYAGGARSTKDSGISTGPEVDSIIGDEEFPFDEELINTAAYRRAFKAAQKQRANPGQSQSPPSTDSSIPPTPTAPSTRTGFSKLFRKAMKFDDKSYSSVLEKKVKERAKVMCQLHDFVVRWTLSCEYNEAPGVITGELENLEYACKALMSLGEKMEL